MFQLVRNKDFFVLILKIILSFVQNQTKNMAQIKKRLFQVFAESAIFSVSLVAVLMFIGCDNRNDRNTVESKASSANAFRDLLSELRNHDNLSFDELSSYLIEWKIGRDSLRTSMLFDTTQHSIVEYSSIHDSIQKELCRLALSRVRTYKEVLQLKEQVSLYTTDLELQHCAEEFRPLFMSMDNQPAYQGDKTHFLRAYRELLVRTMHDGIHSREDLMEFVKKEDAFFRRFLALLHNLDETDMSDITYNTQKCCSEVFFASEREEITYREAMLVMALRINRRLIQNTHACLYDINHGKITSKQQAWAYSYMILQPYVTLDPLCLLLLSTQEKKMLYGLADDTHDALKKIHALMKLEDDRLGELPGKLMEIFIESL